MISNKQVIHVWKTVLSHQYTEEKLSPSIFVIPLRRYLINSFILDFNLFSPVKDIIMIKKIPATVYLASAIHSATISLISHVSLSSQKKICVSFIRVHLNP